MAPWVGDTGATWLGQHNHANQLAAEACLQLGRFADAMAHAERYERSARGEHVKCLAPWLRARIMATEQPKESSSEVVALLEQAAAAGDDWGSPFLVSLVLQDLLALVQLAPAERERVVSRREESLFEMTMELDSPMRRHFDSMRSFEPKRGA